MIRRMRLSDLADVAGLEAENFSVPWSKRQLEESLNDSGYLFFVAEEEGKVIGYGGLLRVLEEGDITNIVVKEAYRGRGIGTSLVKALLEEGRRLGMQEFTLEVRAGNQAAIHVYESLGFVCEGIRRRFYERPAEDAWIMWRRKGASPAGSREA